MIEAFRSPARAVFSLRLLAVIIVMLAISLTSIVYPFYHHSSPSPFSAYAAYRIPKSAAPVIVGDPNLKVETVFKGLVKPTSMAFLGPNDILVLEKNKGTVQRIVNDKMLPEPVLQVPVATNVERGMLGIAISNEEGNVNEAHSNVNNNNNNNKQLHSPTRVFLYYTQSGDNRTGDDLPQIQGSVQPLGNRLYRYNFDFDNGKLVNPKLLLNLPAIPPNASNPETNHMGGKVAIGPDNNVYTVIGEVGGHTGQTENVRNGTPPDGTGGILRVTQDGKPVEDGPFAGVSIEGQQQQQQQETGREGSDDDGSGGLGILLGGGGEGGREVQKEPDNSMLKYYYAYGVRNSFGIDFDPVTKKLWDTENGPAYGDEINLVEPGFNSGWRQIMGIWQRHGQFAGHVLQDPAKLLVNFGGKGKYSPPEFTWYLPIGPTALKFLNSDRLGKQYENDMFVGNIGNGTMFHFKLNQQRTGLLLNDGLLADKVANTPQENKQILFAEGFGGITDIQVGPADGYLYILSYTDGAIYRIVPAANPITSSSSSSSS
jgi:aldose sugar dehydrogenase